jgi:hypothetical protein
MPSRLTPLPAKRKKEILATHDAAKPSPLR